MGACYICGEVGHYAKACKKGNKESSGQSQKPKKGSSKQILTTTCVSEEPAKSQTTSSDPLSYLYSSDSDGGERVGTVRVADLGSKPQFASVQVQGVSATGVVDTGADITIMGGTLFKKEPD